MRSLRFPLLQALPRSTRVGNYYYRQFTDYRAGKDLKLYHLRDSVVAEMHTLRQAFDQMMKKDAQVNSKSGSLQSIATTLLNALFYAYVALKALFGAFGVGSICSTPGRCPSLAAAFRVSSRPLRSLTQTPGL